MILFKQEDNLKEESFKIWQEILENSYFFDKN